MRTEKYSEMFSKLSKLEDKKLNLIADFFSEYELGDFISITEVEQAFGKEYFDYRDLQAVLMQKYELSLWVVRPVNALGFILITAEAQESINKLGKIWNIKSK